VAAWTLVLLGSAASADAQTGSIAGNVSGYSSSASPVPEPVAGVVVTASDGSGTTESATTDSGGNYEIDNLPSSMTYAVTFTPGSAYQAQTVTGVQVSPGTLTVESVLLQPLPASMSGLVTDQNGQPLYGMQVEAIPTSVTCPAGDLCGLQATTGPTGRYSIDNLLTGTYQVKVLDGTNAILEATVNVTGGSANTVNVRLPPAPVPNGTNARNAERDLSYLNAERAGLGLPAGIVLNPRWTAECAAHDAYERDHDVLQHPENPKLRGASAGGAWAGLHSILAEDRWTRRANPWWDAPIHLIQLFSPSLSVIGIDDSRGWQCATTWPGLLRAPVSTDTILTYPAGGAHGVPPSEDAQESPFVPGQFVGIPDGTTAGRELFVYLNQANATGQAPVKILHATLTEGHHPVGVRWVDNTTRTLGPYLSGGILIPVKPLHGAKKYTATVVVQDGSGSLRHTWSFTTARS
jgi:hypothetical protein